MKLKSIYKSKSSGDVLQTYYDAEDLLAVFEDKVVHGSHAICFLEDKLVLVNHPSQGWSLPAGTSESGETYIETTEREVMEETNMKILHQELIGLSVFDRPEKTIRQTRVMSIVEKVGEFVSDPDGEIMEIMLIDPLDYKKYFDWGEIGDRIMQRALELKNKYKK